MKHRLYALTLLATTSLSAEGSFWLKGNAPEESAPPCCCEEDCCCPTYCEQEECAAPCEAFSPNFYDLECACGLSLDVEFLYWYANETNLSYALKIKTQEGGGGNNSFFYAPDKYAYLNTEWDPGFRAGIGLSSPCSGFDLYLSYTWMKNKRCDSTSVEEFTEEDLFSSGTEGLINPWLNRSLGGTNPLFDSVKGRWRLTYNQIDLEIGRKYWTGPCFALRPYAAVRGAFWKTRFNTKGIRSFTGSEGDLNTFNFKDHFSNNIWGVGFLGGLQPTWYFCSTFALFANFDVGLLWGQFEAKKRENYLQEVITSGTSTTLTALDWRNCSKGEFYQMIPMLDAAIGLRWEATWCCNRYRTALDIGWEHHTLFDQNHRIKSFDRFSTSASNLGSLSGFNTYDETSGNLSMGGLVARARFDF